LHTLLAVPSLIQIPSIIIFTNRTLTAQILHLTLESLDHSVTSLHSSLPQSQRTRNLSSFRALKARILIATDVASRGLDIPSVGVVINYDLPRDPRDYVHRVGRTARGEGRDGKGREGLCINFVGPRDVELLLGIERYVSGQTKDEEEAGEEEGDGDKGKTAKENKEPEDTGEDHHEDVDDTRQNSVPNGVDGTDTTSRSTSTSNPQPNSTKPRPSNDQEVMKMQPWTENSVNLETRVLRGRTLKDVAEARLAAIRIVEGQGEVGGWKRKVKKGR
jgi:superfamily II DNA/RNA helicase